MATSSASHLNRPRDGRGRYVRSRDTAERDADACRLRGLGHTYEAIADRLGFADRSRARKAVERGLAAVVAEPASELRTLELLRLDQLWMRAMAVLASNRDGELPLKAIDRLLKIQERRARLLGLDAPTKIQTVTVDTIEAEIERLSAQLGINTPGVSAAAEVGR